MLSVENKKLIIDTDLGNDVDDVAAIGMAFLLQREGKIDVPVVTHCPGEELGAECVEKIAQYYGQSTRVGLTKSTAKCNVTARFLRKMSLSGEKNIRIREY